MKQIEHSTLSHYHTSKFTAIKIFQWIFGNSKYKLIATAWTVMLIRAVNVLFLNQLKIAISGACQMWQSGWFSVIQSLIMNNVDYIPTVDVEVTELKI